MMRRVVVTGLGIVSPVGNNIATAWSNIIAGNSGISLIDTFDTSNHATKIAGLVKDFKLQDYNLGKEIPKCDSFIQYGIVAGIQAVEDAGLNIAEFSKLDLHRTGAIIGAGIGGIGLIESTHQVLQSNGPRRINPFFIPSSLVNMISGHLSIMYGLKGANLSVVTACASGTHSIGLSAKMIKYGDADLMLAGGAEHASTPLCIAGFNAMKALSTRNTDPTKASRPWDKDRDGFVLGDGAGVMVLEEYEHARKRNANIYAELVGVGMSSDAYHITKPPLGATGALSSMQLALREAQVHSNEIGYINAHATSTIVGDVEESLAIQTLFKDQAKNIPTSSTKSMTGHLLGATGAVEAIFAILALRDQIIPATINLDHPAKDCELDYVPNHSRKVSNLKLTMSNSFGFGGTNSTLIFKSV